MARQHPTSMGSTRVRPTELPDLRYACNGRDQKSRLGLEKLQNESREIPYGIDFLRKFENRFVPSRTVECLETPISRFVLTLNGLPPHVRSELHVQYSTNRNRENLRSIVAGFSK